MILGIIRPNKIYCILLCKYEIEFARSAIVKREGISIVKIESANSDGNCYI